MAELVTVRHPEKEPVPLGSGTLSEGLHMCLDVLMEEMATPNAFGAERTLSAVRHTDGSTIRIRMLLMEMPEDLDECVFCEGRGMVPSSKGD